MSAQRTVVARWLPDDTEESILGAEWHQDAISSLCDGLRDVATVQRWSWHVANQLTLVAWHPDGTPWRPKPDVMVHLHAGAAPRREMNAHSDGLPSLIIEVASPNTYLSDVHVERPTPQRPEAKGFEYLAWPLPEYLVFDPLAEHLPGQVRAWRMVDGQVRAWEPDAAGRYHSQSLGVSFRPDGFFLRIFDPAGQQVLFNHEQGAARRREAEARQIAEAARTRAEEEVARLRAEIERLQRPG